MLGSQEFSCPENKSNGNEDDEMDVWAPKRDMIKNEDIRGKVGAAFVADKMQEGV